VGDGAGGTWRIAAEDASHIAGRVYGRGMKYASLIPNTSRNVPLCGLFETNWKPVRVTSVQLFKPFRGAFRKGP